VTVTPAYQRHQVAVPQGTLTVGCWGRGPIKVFASHGITANHRSFALVAEAIDRQSAGAVSLVALDHRGRAGSAHVGAPFGLTSHADDLVAVMDAFNVEQATLVGHSMGGFVIANAAERHPDRVASLTLIDGGLPFPPSGWSEGDSIVVDRALSDDADAATIEAAIHAVIGPALARLDMRWPDIDSYVRFFRDHPAFQPPNCWTATAEGYVRYDAVVTDEGEIRSSVNKDAVLVDGAAAIVDPNAAAALTRITTPSHLLWCPRGLLDQQPGLYPPGFADAMANAWPHLRVQQVEGTNHYTVVTSAEGAEVVAAAVLSGRPGGQRAPDLG